MTLKIVGAGMAGLLTAHMLRRLDPVVHEQQPSLPDNHGALLRFRSDAVSKATGIPFQQVTVHKALYDGRRLRNYATLSDHNMYSYKVTGRVMPRSILSLDPVQRWIAPPTFLADLAKGTAIIFGSEQLTLANDGPWISTIPMPALMTMALWQEFPDQFPSLPIWSVTGKLRLPCDVYQTIYYPDPCGERFYRASITGNTLIMEYQVEPSPNAETNREIETVVEHFGMGDICDGADQLEIKHQRYGKIRPIDEGIRRRFILAMSDLYQCYSIGRFATWRQILLDDVVHDVEVVERFIRERSTYARRLQYS